MRVRSSTLDRLFSDAGQGLLAVLVANLDDVVPVMEKEFRIDADQYDLMLFDWLSELLYTFEAELLLLREFAVTISPRGLHAIGRGEPMDTARHKMDHEIKAVTYHQLKVERENNGWLAEVILDI